MFINKKFLLGWKEYPQYDNFVHHVQLSIICPSLLISENLETNQSLSLLPIHQRDYTNGFPPEFWTFRKNCKNMHIRCDFYSYLRKIVPTSVVAYLLPSHFRKKVLPFDYICFKENAKNDTVVMFVL